MKRNYVILNVAIFTLIFNFHSIANQIIYPWRACPTIVPVGKTIAILYDNLTGLRVDSVILEGPYNRVVLRVDSVLWGKFEYDSFTKATASSQIKVTIPEGTPEELYDLIVKSGSETNISKRSVKVLKEYRNPHHFIHISDPHVSRQWVGTDGNGYSKELELLDRFIKLANIIHPEYVIVTGDIIHDYTRFDANPLGWGGVMRTGSEQHPTVEEKYKNYLEGANGFSGVYGFNAPVFSIPGNHDFYGLKADDYPAKATQWNRLMGKRVFGFSYLDTRFIAADDYLGDPVVDIPDHAPMSGLQGKVLENFLSSAGPGKMRIIAQHRPDRVDTTFMNRQRIQLLLNGHFHEPQEGFVGTTPTLNIRPGSISKSGEIAVWKKTLGFFRIFTIEGDTFRYSPALRFCENPTAPYDQLVMNLTLDFKKDNTGKFFANEAVLSNHFEIDLPDCRVRFIMPKRKRGYKVSGGKIYQTIENSRFLVLDVRTDVKSHGNTIVKIQ